MMVSLPVKARAAALLMLLLLALPTLVFAQTTLPAQHHSYVMPGDSLWIELSLVPGDVMTWSLWLARAGGAGNMELALHSADEGELWRRPFGVEGATLREEVKITRASRYRLTLFSKSAQGRPADLSAWARFGKNDRLPFPMPEEKRLAEQFTAGDQWSVEYEFRLSDTTRMQSLLALDLPRDLVRVWATTAQGDSLVAEATVSRWMGETGKISLRERAPQGGSITLKLTLDIPFDGDATVVIAPGNTPPAWLPASARMMISHRNDPWSVVAVPPQAAADTVTVPPRAPYVAIRLRSLKIDPAAASRIIASLSERDSLLAARRARRGAAYDTTFDISAHAFLAPAMHAAHVIPLVGNTFSGQIPEAMRITWHLEHPRGAALPEARLYEWRYDEARVALDAVTDEPFWDGTLLPLEPKLKVHALATGTEPGSLSLPLDISSRPPRFEKDGFKYHDLSRRVWGFYIENPSADTLYFVYRPQLVVDRPLKQARWPLLARILLIVFAIAAIAGGYGYHILRGREKQRRKQAEEMAAELEKARQTQLKLLPQSPWDITGLQLIGLHQSMQSVGGDYYDFFALEDGRVILCVADVTGHGYKAALIMANLQATMRAVAVPGKSLTDIVSLLNLEVFRRTTPEDFVTLIIAEISADRKTISACNAGHNPGYIVKQSGAIREIEDGGLMLGVLDSYPFCQKSYPLDPGDIIVFYTDGIPEATISANGEMYGYERLKLFLAEHRYSKPRELAQGLIRQVVPNDHSPIEDDMAVLVARVLD